MHTLQLNFWVYFFSSIVIFPQGGGRLTFIHYLYIYTKFHHAIFSLTLTCLHVNQPQVNCMQNLPEINWLAWFMLFIQLVLTGQNQSSDPHKPADFRQILQFTCGLSTLLPSKLRYLASHYRVSVLCHYHSIF